MVGWLPWLECWNGKIQALGRIGREDKEAVLPSVVKHHFECMSLHLGMVKGSTKSLWVRGQGSVTLY